MIEERMTEEELVIQFEDRMKGFNVDEFVENNAPRKISTTGEYVCSLSEEDQGHVSHGLSTLINIYRGEDSGGHFLSAVIRNDLEDAVSRADSSNYRGLRLYTAFIYNHVPLQLAKLVKERYKK